jgi:hypothetical protein
MIWFILFMLCWAVAGSFVAFGDEKYEHAARVVILFLGFGYMLAAGFALYLGISS